MGGGNTLLYGKEAGGGDGVRFYFEHAVNAVNHSLFFLNYSLGRLRMVSIHPMLST